MGLMKKALAVGTLGGSVAAEKVVQAGREDGWTTPMFGPNSKKGQEKQAEKLAANGDGALWMGTSVEAGRNANVVLYADRIEREKPRGLMSLSGAVQDNEVIPIRSVTSVNIKKANMVHSDVVVLTAGGSIPFRLGHSQAQVFKDAVTPLILNAGQPHVVVQQAEPQIDVADQIKKLAELRDQGILSAEEFDLKKAELLSRM